MQKDLLYRPIPANSSRVTIYLEMKDSASPFQPKTGFAFNSAGIVMSYSKKRQAAVTITPVTLSSATAAWVSGGIKEVDATNMVGVVRFDLPNTMFVQTGIDDEVLFSVKATGYEPMAVRIPLIRQEKADLPWNAATIRTNN